MLGAHRCFYKLSFSFYFTTNEFFSWASNSLLLLFLADRDVRAQSVVGVSFFFFALLAMHRNFFFSGKTALEEFAKKHMRLTPLCLTAV